NSKRIKILNVNPFPKSHKYEELIKMYENIAKNGCYTTDGAFVAHSEVFGLSGQTKFKDVLKKIIKKYNVNSLL
mgnify:CR=1